MIEVIRYLKFENMRFQLTLPPVPGGGKRAPVVKTPLLEVPPPAPAPSARIVAAMATGGAEEEAPALRRPSGSRELMLRAQIRGGASGSTHRSARGLPRWRRPGSEREPDPPRVVRGGRALRRRGDRRRRGRLGRRRHARARQFHGLAHRRLHRRRHADRARRHARLRRAARAAERAVRQRQGAGAARPRHRRGDPRVRRDLPLGGGRDLGTLAYTHLTLPTNA